MSFKIQWRAKSYAVKFRAQQSGVYRLYRNL